MILNQNNCGGRYPLPPGLVQRGLTLEQAAALAGLSKSGYRQRQKMGDYPGPTLPGKRYDRCLLEEAMDRLSNIRKASEASSPLDDWRASRARPNSRN